MPPEDDLQKTTFKVSDLERVRAPGFVEVYANTASGGAGFYDLRLVFGQTVTDAGSPRVDERAAVTMGWEHIRALRDVLDRLLTEYEEEHGPIRTQRES